MNAAPATLTIETADFTAIRDPTNPANAPVANFPLSGSSSYFSLSCATSDCARADDDGDEVMEIRTTRQQERSDFRESKFMMAGRG